MTPIERRARLATYHLRVVSAWGSCVLKAKPAPTAMGDMLAWIGLWHLLFGSQNASKIKTGVSTDLISDPKSPAPITEP